MSRTSLFSSHAGFNPNSRQTLVGLSLFLRERPTRNSLSRGFRLAFVNIKVKGFRIQPGTGKRLTTERTAEHFRVIPARIQKLWWDGWIIATDKDDRGMPIFAESQLPEVRGMLEACGDI